MDGADTPSGGTTAAHVTWTPTTGTWYHLVFTVVATSTNMQIYINGVAQTLTYDVHSAVSVGTTTNPFTLGADNPRPGTVQSYLNGSLDEWGVWDRIITGTEVSQLYNGGLGTGYSGGSATSTIYTNVVQNLNYTYDANGNITGITDLANTGAGLTATFGYDALNRVTSASTTAASSTPYRETFSYNPLGNITNKSDLGNYLYSGSGADPDAPTSVNGTTYTYDNDGNLISASPWTYAYDYKKRLINSTNGSASSTYQYDYAGDRVFQLSTTNTTYYPNKYYSVASTSVGS